MPIAPLQYFAGQAKMGHYAVAQRSGSMMGSMISAGDVLARLRWAHPSAYLVLLRLRLGLTFPTAVTTAVEQALQAKIVRAFKKDFDNITSADLAGKPLTGVKRAIMNNSFMGTAGPGVSQNAPMTGGQYVGDNDPFAIESLGTVIPGVSGIPAGYSTGMKTVYEWKDNGSHPVVLCPNEGILVEAVNAGPSDGAVQLYTEWDWAELFSF